MFAVKNAPTSRKISEPGVIMPSVAVGGRPPFTQRTSMPAVNLPDRNSVVKTTNNKTTMRNSVSVVGETVAEEYTEGNIKIQTIIDGDQNHGEVLCVRFNPDGSLLAIGYQSGIIKIFNSDDGQLLHVLGSDDIRLVNLPVTCIRFYPVSVIDKGHVLVATYASGHVRFWHYTSGKCTYSINELRRSGETSSAAFNLDGSRFATVGADPQVHIYDVQTRKRINTLEATDCRDRMDGHRYRVYAIQYHPSDPNVFITGGWDDTIQFWDNRKFHAFRKFYGPHICGDAIDIDPVYGHILTGSWRKDNPLQIWDFGSGEKIKDIPQDLLHNSQLYCAQWLGKDNIACAGSSQNMARVLDRGTLNTVGSLVDLPKGVFCLDNDRQGLKPRLAGGAADKVYLFKTVSSTK